MANAAAARQGDRTTAAEAAPAADFAELRSLIVGPEQRQLRTIQARLDDPATQARDVSRVLPVAMLLRKDDPQMTRALAPTVEEAITASVRRNPRPLADALFPIFGPAIRKAIAASLSSMLESMNQTLEHSLSWRALQWRITALRTGKPFAEIVLLNTLVYRVEQVFLIERDSGLLLQHVKSGTVSARDADMVSGMLTAIRDFVRDSFRVSEDEGLDRFQVGDLSVLVEQGPHAILAAVVRGTPPPELRQSLQEAIEHVHARTGEALDSFSGDTAPFEVVRPTLEGLLESRYQPRRKGVSPALLVAAATIVLTVAAWAFFAWSSRSKWNAYLDALRAEPGIVVVGADRSEGKYLVRGLRDPLARDPASFVAASGLTADAVSGSWQLYQALDPPIVEARARRLLQAPESVRLSFDGTVLSASGSAATDWIRESARLAPLIAGVSVYDSKPLVEQRVRDVNEELSRTLLLFARGSTAFEPGGESVLSNQLQRLRELDEIAQIAGHRYTIEVSGHADGDGTPGINESLSVSRANLVRAAIERLQLSHLDLAARGAGSREPLTRNTSDADKRTNRRVSIRIAAAK